MIVPFPKITPRAASWELRSLTQRFQSPLSGATQTVAVPGSAWAVTLQYPNVRAADRRQLQAFLSSMRGGAARCYVRAWPGTQSAGVPQTVLGSVYDMGSGFTATAAAVNYSDGLAVLTGESTFTDAELRESAGLAATANLVYINRVLGGWTAAEPYLSTPGLTVSVKAGLTGNDGRFGVAGPFSGGRAVTWPLVSDAAQNLFHHLILEGRASNDTVHAHVAAFQHAAFARGALISVPENLLLSSQAFNDATDWTLTNATVDPNQANFAGNTIADELTENAATGGHYVTQTWSGPRTDADEILTLSVWALQSVGDRDLQLRLSDAGGALTCTFDLSTGAISGSPFAGTNWYLPRASIVSANTGDAGQWYRCSISGVFNATASPSTLDARLSLVSAGSVSYTGDNASSVHLFGAQLERSSVAGPYHKTDTTTRLDGTNMVNPGARLYLKGLPASTNNILLPGDFVELLTVPAGGDTTTEEISELKRVVLPVNSDEYGIAPVWLEPQLRNVPTITADFQGAGQAAGTPAASHRMEPCAILWRPQMRAQLDTASVAWTERPGGLSDVQFTLVEDLSQ